MAANRLSRRRQRHHALDLLGRYPSNSVSHADDYKSVVNLLGPAELPLSGRPFKPAFSVRVFRGESFCLLNFSLLLFLLHLLNERLVRDLGLLLLLFQVVVDIRRVGPADCIRCLLVRSGVVLVSLERRNRQGVLGLGRQRLLGCLGLWHDAHVEELKVFVVVK